MQFGNDRKMKRAPEQPITADIKILSGLFIKTAIVPKAGTVIAQHSHLTDHVTLLAVGTMRVWADEVLLGDYTGPTGILIRAGTLHRFCTMTDGLVFACIHAVGADGEPGIAAEAELELED
jgi:quercetin dioxygenase-like cupin family protein